MPESVKALRAAVDRLLPRVELTDVLVEVDGWTGFSSELTGLENESRRKDHLALLYAALLAGACNIIYRDLDDLADCLSKTRDQVGKCAG